MKIRHIVLVKFTEATGTGKISELSKAFAELPSRIPGITSFEAGENVSPEGLTMVSRMPLW